MTDDMATPPNDDTKRLFAALIDRQWHSYWEVRDAIAKSVPPGRALRKYESELMYRRRQKHDGDPDYDTALSEQDRIEFGARSIAQISITSWTRAGALLRRGKGAEKEIMVRPGFTSWGIPGFLPPERDSPPSEPQGDTDLTKQGDRASEVLLRQAEEASVADALGSWEQEKEQVRRFLRPDPEGDWIPAEREDVTVDRGEQVSEAGVAIPHAGSRLACEVCGLTVGDRVRHIKWHEAQHQADTPPEVALLDRSQLKDLLHQVLVDALDQFQERQQLWQEQRFAEVEQALIRLKLQRYEIRAVDQQ